MRLLDELEWFDRLAHLRHYGRASAEVHVSPSTLSRAISRLESDVGVRLFDRDRRGVALTEDGARFHAFARDVLRSWSTFTTASASDAVTGSLSVFCTVTASQSVLPEVLTRFRARHPGIQLTLETGYAAEALERLERGAVDVTVAPMPPRIPRHLLTRPIAQTSLVLVAPTDRTYRIARQPSAAWSSIPFVLPSTGLVRALIDRWFRRHHVRPTIAAETVGHEAVLSLVSLGCGVGVVPELVADESPLGSRLERVRVDVVMPSFEISICTRPEHLDHAPVAAFWATLGDVDS